MVIGTGVVAEQKGGAVLNRNRIPLTDKTTIDFTAMGGFYSNYLSVEGSGLKIVYEIKRDGKEL